MGWKINHNRSKVDALIYTMGPEAEKTVSQIAVRDATGEEVAADTLLARTLKGFTSNFHPRDNILYSNRVQGIDESNGEFICSLYELV